MGFLGKVGSFLKREAKDVGEAAEGMKDRFDDELTKREQELKMTPAEKISAIQRNAAATDARFEALADKATGRGAVADAAADLAGVDANAELPNVTHIVLPDGRVKSGDDVPSEPEVDGVPHVVAPVVGDSTPIPAPPLPPPEEMAPPTTEAATDLPPPPVAAPEAPESPAETPPEETPAVAVADAAPVDVVAESPDLAAAQEWVSAEGRPDIEPEVHEAEMSAGPVASESVPVAPAEVLDTQDAPTDEAPVADEQRSAEAENAEAPGEATDGDDDTPAPASEPDFGKTPAQLKYERARAAANDLLDELRGELKDDGAI